MQFNMQGSLVKESTRKTRRHVTILSRLGTVPTAIGPRHATSGSWLAGQSVLTNGRLPSLPVGPLSLVEVSLLHNTPCQRRCSSRDIQLVRPIGQHKPCSVHFTMNGTFCLLTVRFRLLHDQSHQEAGKCKQKQKTKTAFWKRTQGHLFVHLLLIEERQWCTLHNA